MRLEKMLIGLRLRKVNGGCRLESSSSVPQFTRWRVVLVLKSFSASLFTRWRFVLVLKLEVVDA